ncbi:LOW QUALITY PROTEIN: uncharacterized protein EMH_0053680 [Eimeria mitis]|uniref:tRNA:m(4)X modification enzyme TRM13 n=1 Tax=Eimeria mitis TaxID=44415 RepID=U6K9D4_9EIME|nr:LOW QUALITY PROTEIN: uncharacterized protein EMH_0053680 [Eimeria mitis]CDJ33411.1 hypothetical protein, conserved [Eimeria mitis]
MPVPEIEDPEALSTDTRMLHGAPSERLGGALKRPKPGGEGPLTSSNLHAVAAALHPSASTAASGVSLGTASGRASPGRTSEAAAAASEAAKGALEEAAKGTAATEAAPNDGILSRNRISSGRHGERIACPMDSSHSIYALRVQAHLKKCTKARDIAFSHCLPFMQPGANLPQQQRLDQSEQQRQEDHLQQKLQHGDYVESPETAAALTSEFEAKISDAYRYSLLYLNNMSPKEAATAETAAATPPTAKAPVGAAVPQWDSLEKLPASIFKKHRWELLYLNATQVPLDTGTAAAEGHPLAWLEADLKRALLLPQQDRSSAILQVLQQLQQRLNKHQKQLLQLLALCLLHSHLKKSSLDETLIVELGAGKGDLTRWLCCWSAVAVAANAQREPAAAAPQVPAAAAAAGAPGALHTHAPRQHRGVRCIVVDREARRYCKEAKDKTFRNPNSLRPLHPAAVAAAERRKAAAAATVETAVEENTSLGNPLLGEEMTAGPAASALSDPAQTRTVGDAASSVIGRPPQALASLTPAATGTNASCSNPASTSSSGAALPVPPVRLRMDIADFSLVALVKYIACKGPLRVPHIPGFFKKLFEYGCRFAVPKPRLEQEGAKETRGERCKVNGDGMHSLANVAEATNVGEDAK